MKKIIILLIFLVAIAVPALAVPQINCTASGYNFSHVEITSSELGPSITADDECKYADTGDGSSSLEALAKWEYDEGSGNYSPEGDPNDTNVTGSDTLAYWEVTGEAVVVLVVSKEGQCYQVLRYSSGEDNGIITPLGQFDISHITLCQGPPDCGNGVVEEGEECDLGRFNGYVCDPPYGHNGYAESCSYCNETCGNITLTDGFCGDQQIQYNEGEQCESNEDCTDYGPNAYCANCLCYGTPPPPPICGDGEINQEWEQCDLPESQCEAGETCNPDTCLCEPTSVPEFTTIGIIGVVLASTLFVMNRRK